MTDILRTWLIAALTHQELPALAEQRVAELVDVASDQGVLVLLEHRLLSQPSLATLPDNLFSQIQQQAKLSLLQQLPFFAEQKQVYQALNRAQIPFLVMKGAALGYWLYDSPNHRPVTDIDVWFEDRQTVDALAEMLRQQPETASALAEMMNRQAEHGGFTSTGEVEIPHITTDFELTLQAARAMTAAPGWLEGIKQDPAMLLFTLYTAVVGSLTEASVLNAVVGADKSRPSLRRREKEVVAFVRAALEAAPDR